MATPLVTQAAERVVEVIVPVPQIRIRACNAAPLRSEGDYVLYWMVAYRRTAWNFALDRSIEQARRLGKPLVVFEALRAGYPWASDRHHAFILAGMADTWAACREAGITYMGYVEPRAGDGRGLLDALASHAAIVVTDDFPAFFIPRLIAAAGAALAVRLEAVDSNGVMPLSATEKPYPTAFSFRAFLHKNLRPHFDHFPDPDPFLEPQGLTGARIEPAIAARWPHASEALMTASSSAIGSLEIDHTVAPVTARGGMREADRVLSTFLDTRLKRYKDARGVPDEQVASGLSPYLHFGHIAVHQVFRALMTREGWTTRWLSEKGGGKREGWWNVSPAAESFLDECITWRELGFVTCHHRPDDYDRYESLPTWALRTLGEHAADDREFVYALDEFANAATHDELWNAAQRQLRREGIIHNYLRMLWGKKILEWTSSPQEALAVMTELNNRYALDGRDPNSSSGIFWVLGRYDRPWAPERPVYGTIRYMSSANTAKKASVKRYLRAYGADEAELF